METALHKTYSFVTSQMILFFFFNIIGLFWALPIYRLINTIDQLRPYLLTGNYCKDYTILWMIGQKFLNLMGHVRVSDACGPGLVCHVNTTGIPS